MLEFLKTHLMKFLTVPVFLNALNFSLLLLQALSDGVLSDEEILKLIHASTGIQLVFLAIVMALLKKRK